MEPINVKQVEESNDELSDTITFDKAEEKNDIVDAIHFVYNNVHSAQLLKGVFSMQECRLIISAKDSLLEFFKTGNESFTTKEINKEFVVFLQGCEKQQATGAFHMQGSVALLDKLTLIEKEINKRKSPVDVMKELRQKISPTTRNNNRKRGGKNT